jgi:cardiolipin synthase
MSISARLACRAATRCAANISLRPAAVRFAPRHTTPVKLQSLFFTRAQSWQENKNHQKNQDEKPIGTQPPTPPDVTPSRPAEVLHEDIYTVPNILTFTRLAAAPVIGYLVLHDQHAWAVGLFAYAGITDLLDGWIARRWDSKTVVGTVIDPMADKMLMTILTICLAAKGALPSAFCLPILTHRGELS